jgi:hypothetical protein
MDAMVPLITLIVPIAGSVSPFGSSAVEEEPVPAP